MRAPRCTIDSSCVIALDHLDLLPQLSFLFSLVLVPKAVRDDIFKRRATKKRVRSLFDQYAFFERCDDYDRGTVDFLLAERAREAMKDRGEVEAIVQAAQSGATVIVDDPWGRILAERYDLDFHGTVWVLERFYELGLISAAALRANFAALRDRGTRLPWDAVNGLLTGIGEQPLET
jgi:predicted nucleic acid-binding protein